MENLQIYRNTSVDWKPSAVVALVTSPDGSQVAAAREDSSLEIWLVSPGSVGWHCQLTIQGECNSRVTSLIWCRTSMKDGGIGRLLSSNIDGSVSEWNLFSLKQQIILETVGFSIWKMALEPLTDVIHNEKKHSELLINGHEEIFTDNHSECCQSDDDANENNVVEINSLCSKKEYQHVAIACDDGCMRLYRISDSDRFSYRRSFPRVSGRTLSVEWSLDAKFLFSGSSDGLIRCWDSTSGIEVYRITVGLGGISNESELCVWSLLFLRCGTIVSSDSTGSVQFWDSNHGTLLQTHSYHKGDANALAADPSHKRVFSAGSDGKVILYKASDETEDSENDSFLGETNKWAYVGYSSSHTHDIRCLVVAVPIVNEAEDLPPNEKSLRKRQKTKPMNHHSYHKWAHLGVPMLLSAGDDAKIFAYSATDFKKFDPHDICPAPQRGIVHLALNSVIVNGAPIIMTQSSVSLDILSVELGCGTTGISKGGNTTTTLLARIKARGRRKIISSAISSSGMLLAYSDHMKPCLFELRRDKALKNKLIVSKRKLPQGLPYAHAMIFSSDSSLIIISGQDRKIYVVSVEKEELLHVFIPCRNQNAITTSPSEPPITKMFTSFDGQWLAAINCFGDIYIFNLEIYRQHWFISRLDGASVTAGGFPPGNCNVLIIMTSSNQVYVFDVEAKELGDWSRHNAFALPRSFQEFPGEVVGLSFPPSSSTSVIVYSSRAMCFVDFGMPIDQDDIHLPPNGSNASIQHVSPKKITLKKRKNAERSPLIFRLKNFDFCAFNDPVLFLNHVSEKSLFVIQKPWIEVVESFGLPVHKHIYGT